MDDGLITVADFALKYRVDAAVVRGWVKRGYIDYVLVGPRHMKCIREKDVVKPITIEVSGTNGDIMEFRRGQLIGLLIVNDPDIGLEGATEMVASMDLDTISTMIKELEATYGS